MYLDLKRTQSVVGCIRNAYSANFPAEFWGESWSALAMTAARQRQIERNYNAFRQMLPEIIETHADKFALMKDGKVVEYFDTARDAYVAGLRLYEGKPFSVQQVVDSITDLGFFSHAVPERSV